MSNSAEVIDYKIQEKLWNLDYIKIFIIALLYNISSQILISTHPSYVISLGASPKLTGIMMGLLTVFALLSRPIVGYILDTKGRKNVLLIGLGIMIIGTTVFYLVPIVGVIIVFRVIQGIGISFSTTSSGTITADVVPTKKISEGIAYFGLTNTLGTAIGPAIGIALLTSSGNYSNTFLIATLVFIFALFIAFSVNYEKKDRFKLNNKIKKDQQVVNVNNQDDIKTQSFFWRMFEKTALAPSVVVLMAAISMSVHFSFLLSFAISKNIPNAGMFFSVAAITMLMTRVLTSKLIAKVNTILLLVPSIIIFAISFFMIAYANDFNWFIICSVLYGFGTGSIFPLLNALAVSFSPANRRGAANATYLSSIDIGMGIGCTLWGFVIEGSGYFAMFTTAGCIGVIALIFSIILLRNKKLNIQFN